MWQFLDLKVLEFQQSLEKWGNNLFSPEATFIS